MLRERDGETERVAAAVRAARDGRGGLLACSGPFGIGRSALLGQIAATARRQELRVLRAVAGPAERELPGAVLEQFPPVPGRAGQPPDFAALRTDLLSAATPSLVVVDDLHCADAESLRWLEKLSRQLPGSRVLLVVAHRDGDPSAEPEVFAELLGRAERIELPPLGRDGVAAVVADVFGAPADEEFVQACQRVSHGRPLLLAALLHGLRDTGGRPTGSNVDSVSALRPSGVGERACTALSAQPAAVVDTARAIALLDEARPEMVAQLSGLPAAASAAATRALTELGLVVRGDGLPRFAHPVIGTAVEAALSGPEIAEWHSRAARLLQAERRPPEAVARHLLATDTAQGEWSTGVLHAAGRCALDRDDRTASIRYLRRALLACPTDGVQRSVLLADLALAERSSDPVASMRHLAQALPQLASAEKRAEALADVPPLLLGVAPQSLFGELERLRAHTGVEPEVADAVDTRLRAARLCDPGWFDDTVTEFAELRPDSAATPDRAAVLLYAATLTGSDVDGVRPWARRVLSASTGARQAFGTAPLAARAMAMADDVESAEQWLREIGEQAREHGEDSAEALVVDAQLSHLLARSGRHAEAVPLADRTLSRCDPAMRPVVARCVESLALSALDTADPAKGGRVLERHGEWDSALPVWVRELRSGALAVLAHDAEAGLEHLLECGRELERMGWTNPCLLPWRSWVALLYHRLQRPQPAVELISEEYRRAVAWGAPSGVGRALRVWGVVTDGDGGIELFRRAIDVLRGPACALELAKAHLMLGRRLLPTDRAEAATQLGEGDRLAAGCGLPRLRSAEGIAVDGGSVQAELTRAELRIARLVAGGLGNQQIATELGVSSRAVEKHLTKVYRKLGVAGRAGLAALADSLESG